MKAVVAAFNQEKALVGALCNFSLREGWFEALSCTLYSPRGMEASTCQSITTASSLSNLTGAASTSGVSSVQTLSLAHLLTRVTTQLSPARGPAHTCHEWEKW